jgi:hypothetical protein
MLSRASAEPLLSGLCAASFMQRELGNGMPHALQELCASGLTGACLVGRPPNALLAWMHTHCAFLSWGVCCGLHARESHKHAETIPKGAFALFIFCCLLFIMHMSYTHGMLLFFCVFCQM